MYAVYAVYGFQPATTKKFYFCSYVEPKGMHIMHGMHALGTSRTFSIHAVDQLRR